MENQTTKTDTASVAGAGCPASPCSACWTPIEDGLPEYQRGCLVWCPLNQNIFAAYYYFYAGINDPDRKPIWAFFDAGGPIDKITQDITHWMPMPSPPNVKGRDSANE